MNAPPVLGPLGGAAALVISHDPSEVAGLVGRRLEQHGVALEPFVVCDAAHAPVSHRAFPGLDGYDLVLVMGAPWSVYDRATIGSWIDRELALLGAAVERGMPVLGICFGAQALSAALGGTVERAPRPELGWVRVDTDAPDVVASGPWFEWHRDRFTVPPGGVALARTDAGVQAFRFGNCMGVQFHPEVDVTLLGSWLGDDGTPDALFGELGVDPCELLTETAAREQASAANACRLVDHFLEEVAR